MLFRDVVSNVALGRQSKDVLAFYIKRIGQEQGARVVTAVLALLLVGFQAVTVIAPPQVSEASAGSGNDILYGGFRSKDDLLRKFDSNPELRAIYTRVGIGRDEIVRSFGSRVNSSWDVWSMGRTRHGEQNVALDIPGAHTAVYLRPLRVWGTNKWFSGLEGKTAAGKQFWILYDCGNPVFAANTPGEKVPPPSTPPQTPPPSTPPPTTPPPTTPPPTPKPASYSCESLAAYADPTNTEKNPPLKVTFQGQAKVENTTLKSYIFEFGDGETTKSTGPQVTHTYSKAGTYRARLRIETAAGTTGYVPACEQKLVVDSPETVYLKQAVNLTIKDSDGKPTQAAGTTVAAGNEIRYTISAQNTGTGVIQGFVFEESIGDILEYADVTDLGGAKLVERQIPGQEKLVEKLLVWDPIDIAAGKKVAKQFVVKVKNPIPTTPTGASDKNSFDLKMENIFYGSRIEIKLPPPPVKQVETVTQTLPQTGAGFATTALALFTSGMVFVLLRNRLIRRELEILATQEGGRHA